MKKCLSIYVLCMCALMVHAQAIFHVHQGERIADALALARAAYADQGQSSTILIEPGTYYEELTIDVPNLTLRNAAQQPSIGVRNGGVDIDENAVRISWYCGHGYQYKSMGDKFNYGGSRMRRWNASVLVDAPGFAAYGIIFENSFNQYISPAEAADVLVDATRASELCGRDMSQEWTEKERPKRVMPERPTEVWNTDVQKKEFIERAAAISFTDKAKNFQLIDCRCVGHQDVIYGDHGASGKILTSVLQGGVDYIFGGMTLLVLRSELVAQISDQKNDKCYIAAGRGANRERIMQSMKATGDSLEDAMTTDATARLAIDSIPENEFVKHGMLFYECTVRFATEDEIVHPGNTPVCLARPWRWWGETLFVKTKAAEGVLEAPDKRFNLGLTKGHVAPWSSEVEDEKQWMHWLDN